jgi:acetyl esterase/lipase
MSFIFNDGLKLFDPGAIDMETSAFNEKIEKELSAIRPLYTHEPQVIRDARDAGFSVFGPIKHLDDVDDRVISGLDTDVRLRVYIPEQVTGVYLHIHGGGFVLNRARYYDELLVNTGSACKVAVVSVDYRKAPENPYPVGLNDCETAALWLVENCGSEFGTEKMMIGGESAGANLSVTTLLRMRDRHGYRGFCGAVLNYGAYDLTLTPSARRWGERNLILTTKLIEWFHEKYASAEKYSDPDLSPLYADLDDLPPALFTIGTLDPLIDDTMFMHMRWLAAGNRSQLAVYPGGIHAFNAFPIELARKANAKINEFINAQVLKSPEGKKNPGF